MLSEKLKSEIKDGVHSWGWVDSLKWALPEVLKLEALSKKMLDALKKQCNSCHDFACLNYIEKPFCELKELIRQAEEILK